MAACVIDGQPVTWTGSDPRIVYVRGELACAGMRVHDFRASASGEGAVFEVQAPDDVRVIVARIPHQAGPGG